MADKDFFLATLKEKFSDLQNLAIKNKYKILVPPKKFTVESMLTENFYNNHIFYVSKYDENMYINLNGKVLQFQHPKFRSYLGWKKKGDKEMEFSIREQFNTTSDLSCIIIDNVCDEQNYNEPTTIKDARNSENKVQKKDSMDEYLKYYNINNFGVDYMDAVKNIDNFACLMRNNYIFMKNYENNYSAPFTREFRLRYEEIRQILGREKIEESLLVKISNELTESLIFSRMYDFIMKNLINFNEEEEKELKTKMKELPNKNELYATTNDECFKDCKFEEATTKLKDLPNSKTPFEKLKLLTEVNVLIGKEAKEAYEKAHNKKTYSPQGDLVIALWVYVVSHSDIKNILAESAFLNYFGNLCSEAFGESNYLSTTFISAVESLSKDYLGGGVKSSVTQNISPSRIETQKTELPKPKVNLNQTSTGKK